MPEVSTFKDLSVTFKKHPVTNDLVTVKDKAAVAQSIKGLLLTRRGERPFQPDLGSGLQDLLFEPMDYFVSSIMQKEIETTLENYEPRIELIDVQCNPNFDLDNYEIRIEFYVVGVKEPQVYTNVLERLR